MLSNSLITPPQSPFFSPKDASSRQVTAVASYCYTGLRCATFLVMGQSQSANVNEDTDNGAPKTDKKVDYYELLNVERNASGDE